MATSAPPVNPITAFYVQYLKPQEDVKLHYVRFNDQAFVYYNNGLYLPQETIYLNKSGQAVKNPATGLFRKDWSIARSEPLPATLNGIGYEGIPLTNAATLTPFSQLLKMAIIPNKSYFLYANDMNTHDGLYTINRRDFERMYDYTGTSLPTPTNKQDIVSLKATVITEAPQVVNIQSKRPLEQAKTPKAQRPRIPQPKTAPAPETVFGLQTLATQLPTVQVATQLPTVQVATQLSPVFAPAPAPALQQKPIPLKPEDDIENAFYLLRPLDDANKTLANEFMKRDLTTSRVVISNPNPVTAEDIRFTLDLEDQQGLKPKEYLGDKHIMATGNILQAKYVQTQNLIRIGSTFLYSVLMKKINKAAPDAYTQVYAAFPARNILDKKFLVLPINIDQTHWITVVINTREHSLHLFDSIKSPEYEIKDLEIQQNIIQWYKAQTGVDNVQMDTTRPLGMPEQLNGYDCGLYVLFVLEMYLAQQEHLLFDKSFKQLQNKNIVQAMRTYGRKNVAALLESNFSKVEPIARVPQPIEPSEVQEMAQPSASRKRPATEAITKTPAPKKRIEIPRPIIESKSQAQAQVAPIPMPSKEDRETIDRNSFLDPANQADIKEVYTYVYPDLNDPDFNVRLTNLKQLSVNSYQNKFNPNADGLSAAEAFEKYAEEQCNAEFKLAPHQKFVKTFLSIHSPYKSLLLFHSVGTGKTCSAIGIAEEMRDYMRSTGVLKRILVVCNTNVQRNFQKELLGIGNLSFDYDTQSWTHRGCIGNKLLNEVNLQAFTTEMLKPEVRANRTEQRAIRNRVVASVKAYYKMYYEFMSYKTFATMVKELFDSKDEAVWQSYSNRLLIIDEVQNVTSDKPMNCQDNPDAPIHNSPEEDAEEQLTSPVAADDTTDIVKPELKKKVTRFLFKLAQKAQSGQVKNLRLLFLSATPMYDNPRQLIFLLNVMNMVDQRPCIDFDRVFQSDEFNNLLEPSDADADPDVGANLLIRKATGYVSFVRGENPFTFPFRVWPSLFEPANAFKLSGLPDNKGTRPLPTLAMTANGGTTEIPEDSLLKYTDVYAVGVSTEAQEKYFRKIAELAPSNSETSTMLRYTPNQVMALKLILMKDKFTEVIKCIKNTGKRGGIVLVYCSLVEKGLKKLAEMLEMRGYRRYSKTQTQTQAYNTFILITGEETTKQNQLERDDAIEAAVSKGNEYGQKVKVILISRTAGEGVDFKWVRQVHVLDPWYNMSAIEQVIGRGVRFCSHKKLAFNERNTQIYLHCAVFQGETHRNIESIDMNLYRVSEQKALAISKITRLLKQTAIDCYVHREQQNMTVDDFKNLTVNQTFANGTFDPIFPVGDKPYSSGCDYTVCQYQCLPIKPTDKDLAWLPGSNTVMYNSEDVFIRGNVAPIVAAIKNLFKDRLFFNRTLLLQFLAPFNFDEQQIQFALDSMVADELEQFTDRYGRLGHLINIDVLYLFQPLKLKQQIITHYDRQHFTSVPLTTSRPLVAATPQVVPTVTWQTLQDTIKSEDFKRSTELKLLYDGLRMTPKVAETETSALVKKVAFANFWDQQSVDARLDLLNHFAYLNPEVRDFVYNYAESKALRFNDQDLYILNDRSGLMQVYVVDKTNRTLSQLSDQRVKLNLNEQLYRAPSNQDTLTLWLPPTRQFYSKALGVFDTKDSIFKVLVADDPSSEGRNVNTMNRKQLMLTLVQDFGPLLPKKVTTYDKPEMFPVLLEYLTQVSPSYVLMLQPFQWSLLPNKDNKIKFKDLVRQQQQ